MGGQPPTAEKSARAGKTTGADSSAPVLAVVGAISGLGGRGGGRPARFIEMAHGSPCPAGMAPAKVGLAELAAGPAPGKAKAISRRTRQHTRPRCARRSAPGPTRIFLEIEA